MEMRSRRCLAARHDSDAGVIAVTTALTMVILVMAVAFALDTGRWYVEGQRLQRTVDAASLAGAPYLPGDLAKARIEARKLIDRNGYDSTTVPDSGIVIADRPSRLKVTMSNTIPNLFATVIGINTQTLTRTATADYAAAAAMGSPCNVLGNEPPANGGGTVASGACPTAPNFWQNIAGPDAPKGNGDRYATRKCTSTSHSNCDASGNNLDYSGGVGVIGQSYYVYKITAKSAVGSMTVELFDPMFVDVGDQCERANRLEKTSDGLWDGGDGPNPFVSDATQRYAWGNNTTTPSTAGTFCTGDILFDTGSSAADRATNAAKLNTTFALLNPTDTFDPLRSTVICKDSYGGFSGDLTKALVAGDGEYNATVAENFRQWRPMCTISNPEVGRDYYLLVRTNIPPTADDARVLNPAEDSSVGGGGHNRYGIRVKVGGGASSAVAMSALERMPIYANLKSGTTDFYLARVSSANAGNLLKITFFDTGDASGNATIAIKNPQGLAPVGCKAQGDVRTSPTSDFDETTCTLSNVLNSNGYNGMIQRIDVPVPTSYTCNDADPTDCWYRLKFTYPPGVTANDTTTWSASLDGDPVRLVK